MDEVEPLHRRRPVPYVIRMGRTDGTVKKTCFMFSKKQALQVGNAIAYLLWEQHPFRSGECNQPVRIEREGFWLEVKPA